MDLGSIYHEDGIEFTLVKRFKEQPNASRIAKKIGKSGYYARVKPFRKKGEILFYGVIMSTKPKPTFKSRFNDSPFTDDPMFDIRYDFQTAKEKMITIDLDFYRHPEIKTTKLKISSGVGCYYNFRSNIVTIGSKSSGKYNRRIARFIIVHELLHAYGLRHNNRGRQMGYYARINRDTLTPKIIKKIGWIPPKKEDWSGYIEERLEERYKRQEKAKYKIYCPKCKYQQYRQKRSKIINNPESYICPKCGKIGMKSEEL